jgi:hypothetical protein
MAALVPRLFQSKETIDTPYWREYHGACGSKDGQNNEKMLSFFALP